MKKTKEKLHLMYKVLQIKIGHWVLWVTFLAKQNILILQYYKCSTQKEGLLGFYFQMSITAFPLYLKIFLILHWSVSWLAMLCPSQVYSKMIQL